MNFKIKYFRTFSIIILCSVILSGATVISYYRVPRIWLCGLLGIIGLLLSKKSDKIGTKKFIPWYCWVIYLFVSCIYSYAAKNTFNSAVIYLCFLLLIFINYNKNDMNLLYKIIKVVCFLFAVSICISVILPELFTNYLSFLISTPSRIVKSEIAEGIYSGLAGEKSNAAFYMNIGIALELAEYNKIGKFKLKNYTFVLLYLIALMLTGKRTLLLVSMLIIALAIKLFDIKGKYVKFLLAIFIIVPVMFGVINMIPQTQVVMNRFVGESEDTTFNGRQKFWDFCIKMNKDKPLFGYGYDTFNEVFANEVHYVYNGKVWDMYAHNIYYELLGETGYVGIILFLYAVIGTLFNCIKLYKKENISKENQYFLFFATAVQIIFLSYGLTGNVIYSHYELGFYFTSLIIYKYIINQTNNNKIKEKVNE